MWTISVSNYSRVTQVLNTIEKEDDEKNSRRKYKHYIIFYTIDTYLKMKTIVILVVYWKTKSWNNSVVAIGITKLQRK